MNVPNTLSLLRLFLVTPFLIAIIYKQYALALVLFLLAGISDFLDGFLARRLNQTSLLGTYLDPMGDKLLTTVAFVALSLQGLVPAWLAVLVVAKDVYVALGSGVLHFAGNVSAFVPSFWGKFSTLLQIVAMGIVLLSAIVPLPEFLIDVLFVGTGLVTVVAGVHYIWRGLQDFPARPDEAGE